ncbi:DNA-directed RNA polymerase [Paracoccus sp. (in: a-proteobacteria)]|uniref:DNA-directed RNA polymerase n=1 Tax=Paracoccus sp. TaxID=267 RepID=UPI0026DF23A5|nr:DNA-directed RNA polymerase [Paracoccus sp. (in: a-proteobacteria)]MDO5647346.1 hypothetical protein [Paracoccus sp. (in: a-proteobacteria)]
MTKHYAGGYFLNNEPIVRGFGPNAHTAADLSQISNYAVEALNAIQETPWRVNLFILDTVLAFQKRGKDLGFTGRNGFETVLKIARPDNPKNDPKNPVNRRLTEEEWACLDRDGKQRIKKETAREYKRYEEELGVWRATARIVKLADEMSQFDRFYFPHNMDFRTRIYPIPNDLTPQSNDLSKGLLRFARGTRLGEAGVFWLGVSVASHWGEDKLSMADRFAFASEPEFFEQCMQWVRDPMTNQGWLKADKPFQFLAAAHEWVTAQGLPDGPEAFVSYLPGNLDGSCNGAQHLSIMARDMVGAEATNCCDRDTRFDLYMSVADRVWGQVQTDAEKGLDVAVEWVPRLLSASDRRTVVKRAVMTVPYGVTEYGVAGFMEKDGHVDGMDNEWDAARYMRDLIMASIDSTLSNGRALQRWFQACAVRCAEAGMPLTWDTPAGSKVTQAYRNVVQNRVLSYDTRFYLYAEPEEYETKEEFHNRIGMDVRKMGSSAPPNVVHSCDASHLQITTVRMADAGIRDFSMIHDSFGCPMAYVGLMRDILRQTAVDMYSGDYLQIWKESVERYSGLVMPEPPEVGDFNVFEILGSEYFFS